MGWSSKNFRLKFLSHSAEELRRETFQCVTTFGCGKSLDKREGGKPRFSVKNFLSHSAEEFRRETFQCVTTFGCRRSFDKRGGRQYQDYLSKFFCLTVPKNIVREPYSVSLISGMEKNFASEGDVTNFDFLSNF